MKFLFSSPSGPEVGLLKSLLDEAGIACEVRNESTSSILPGAQFQAEVWVTSDDDYARACEIRDSWHQNAPGDSSANPHLIEIEKSNAFLRLFSGALFLAAALVLAWLFATVGQWGHLTLVVILLGIPGTALFWSAVAAPHRRKRK
jgi:hypothetical protein